MASFLRALAVAAMLLSAATAYAGQYLDKVAAVVNGDMITLYDVDERVDGYLRSEEGKRLDKTDPRIMAELRDKALRAMIDDILITQEAKRLKINISDTDIEKEIQNMLRRTGMSSRQFDDQLVKEGISRKAFIDFMRRDITKQQILTYMVQRKVLVTDDDVRKAGGNPDEAKAAAAAPAAPANTMTVQGVRLGLIILPKADTAKDVRKKIASKELSFADAARRYSVGPAKEQGGDLGFIAFKDMSPELMAASKGLSAGTVSEVITLEGKPSLITVSDVQQETASIHPAPDAPNAPASSAGDAAYERVYKAKAEKQFTDYMTKLRSRAIIEIKL